MRHTWVLCLLEVVVTVFSDKKVWPRIRVCCWELPAGNIAWNDEMTACPSVSPQCWVLAPDMCHIGVQISSLVIMLGFDWSRPGLFWAGANSFHQHLHWPDARYHLLDTPCTVQWQCAAKLDTSKLNTFWFIELWLELCIDGSHS